MSEKMNKSSEQMKPDNSKRIREAFNRMEMNDSDMNQIFDNIWDEVDSHSETVEMNMMNKIIRVAAAVAAVMIVSTGTVYAVSRILSGEQIFRKVYKEEVEDENKNENYEAGVEKIAAEFGKKKSEVMVQKCNGYTVTYLGYVSVDDSIFENMDTELKTGMKEELNNGVTYLITAIESDKGFSSNDGEMKESFVMSTFIQGYNTWEVNAFSLGAGSTYRVIDNVCYTIMEYDVDLDVFADRKIYLGVFDFRNPADGFGYKLDSNGEIVRDESTDTLNALFEIEVDKSGADKEKADAIIEKILNDNADDTEGKSSDENTDDEIDESIDDNDKHVVTYATQDELKELIKQSKLIEKDDQLKESVRGKTVYGYAGREHEAYTDWLKSGKVDYQWDYFEEENVLYIFEMTYRDSNFYQNVYEYEGNPKELEWLQNRLEQMKEK
jgi:hypothetical protein